MVSRLEVFFRRYAAPNLNRLNPRLTPWATILRRSAAPCRCFRRPRRTLAS